MRALSDALTVFAEATADYDRLLEVVARSAGVATNAICSVALLEGADVLRVASNSFPHAGQRAALDAFNRDPIKRGESSVGWRVLESGAPVIIPAIDLDQMRERLAPRVVAFLRELDVRSLIAVAMRARGTPYGVLTLMRCGDGQPLDAFDLELAQDLASHAALALANARLLELTRRQAEQLHANRLLDAIIEHMPSMVFVKEARELSFVRFNKAGEELLGLPREQLLGKTDHDFFPPAEAAFFQAKDRETLAGKQLVEILEEPIQTARGERWLHTRKVPILDEHGTPTHLLGISYDITERRLADARLRAAKEAAELANAELEAFSYSVAHDLRAPLRAIDGFAQALLEDNYDQLDAGGKRSLDRVRESAQRMAALIDDLLALSRVSRAELVRHRVELDRVAAEVVERLRRGDPERAVEVAIEPGLVVDADPRLMTVVLENLLGNAWKFTGKTARPRIEVARTGGAFVVRDNGAGFDQTYVGKLFGVFQRLHREADFPGTGIGLATVARIIRRHHGRVWAEGQLGHGAAFYFTVGAAE